MFSIDVSVKRKIESFALKYNKTIALINVAVTLLMGIASLFVSYNALIVSKNQEELFKLQMQYLEAENTPQFSLGDISENEDYIIYNIVGNGAIINEARLNPTTILTISNRDMHKVCYWINYLELRIQLLKCSRLYHIHDLTDFQGYALQFL